MRHTKPLILTGLLCAALLTGFQEDQTQDKKARVELQAAIKVETVDGDLKGAIERYKKIIARDDAERTTVAAALLRMGGCYEKLGDAELQEARKVYERVVREYSDQPKLAAEARAKLTALAGPIASAPDRSTLAVRLVWANADVTGRVSGNGRILSFTDWESGGNVAVRDLVTGKTRLLTDTGGFGKSEGTGFAEPSMPSPDGEQVAYSWAESPGRSLCVVGLDGSNPRVLRAAGNDVLHHIPIAWSPDGRHLLAEFQKTDGTRDMMLVTVEDGSAKLLKAMGKNPLHRGTFSPDGRFIAWAIEEGISLFDLRTESESLLIQDRSNPGVLGWAPDGKHILFSSERGGSADAWLLPVENGNAMGEPIFVKKNWGNRPMGFTTSGAFYYGVVNNVWNVRLVDLDQASGKVISAPQPAFRRGNTRSPGWSPDGHWLASVDGRTPSQTVIVRSMETGEEKELGIGEWTIGMGGLHWTPDGNAVVVPGSGPEQGNSLIRIDVQNGKVTPIMLFPALGGWPRYHFSRDGNTIFYVRPDAGFVSHDLRSGRETEIIQAQGLYWGAMSPDEKQVVIAVNSRTSWALLIRPASGGEIRELIRVDKNEESPYFGSPSWISDGRFIVFLMGVKGKAGEWRLLRVPADGGEPQQIGLVAAPRLQGVRIRPDGSRMTITDIEVGLEVWVMENFLPVSKAGK